MSYRGGRKKLPVSTHANEVMAENVRRRQGNIGSPFLRVKVEDIALGVLDVDIYSYVNESVITHTIIVYFLAHC